MTTLGQQIQDTERRFRRHQERRRARGAEIEALRRGEGDWRRVDEPERVLNRLISLGQRELAGEAMASLAVLPTRPAGAPAAPEVGVLERILAENNLLGVTFLLKGAMVSRAVGRVVVRRSGRVAGFGTGFLVSPQLMMTNNHVLDNLSTAAQSSIQFNFFDTEPGRSTLALEFRLRPDRLFLTDRRLDYSLVAVEPRSGDSELARRGWIPLIAASGKAVVGERVNIIQHPAGQPQQVSVHQNQILDLVDEFLHYSTDTERGSSGSPVLNDQWEAAALHHSGVPKRDAEGRILLVDGAPWDGSERDREKIRWEANEGVRISQIVAHLQQRVAGRPNHQRLLEDCFEPCAYDLENLRLRGTGEPEVRREPLAGSGPSLALDGTATWVLPLTVRVELPGASRPAIAPGGAAPPADDAPPLTDPLSGAPPIDERLLGDALARLEEHRHEIYFDAEADRASRDAYYPPDLGDLEPQDLFRELGRLLESTHTTRLSYGAARLEHLYPWVDLRPDRQLKSIYSGAGFSPEEVIRLDLEVAAARAEALRERMAAEAFTDAEGVEAMLDDLEAEMPFNCEHVVPQSWFDKAQPMKADLHHLFTCEAPCNSFRGNTPYFQFPPDAEEAFRDACGRSEDGRTKFEPVAGKGPVARATLYFLLRYPGTIGDEMRELQAERLKVLLGWHADFPVDEYERHRNAAIFAVQGNRNPLIDLPEIAEAIDFGLGFGVLAGP